MNRASQLVLIASTILASWLGMQAVHELGHVLGAWLTGGRIERVVLHPLTISRTDFADNPQPLLVVWAGPVFGVVAPLLLWMTATTIKLRCAFGLRFFAGSCLLANGLYIGFGSFGQVGDCGQMLRHSSQMWHLWLFGGLTAPAGLLLWQGQGSHFGLGKDKPRMNASIAYGTFAVALSLFLFGLLHG